jgi:hypothetical protein
VGSDIETDDGELDFSFVHWQHCPDVFFETTVAGII